MRGIEPQPPVLPDILREGLRLVLCGTAPGRVSAARGQYYAHPQNRFWHTLYQTGLTPRLLAPAEYPHLLAYGIGLTDIAKHDFGQDSELRADSLGPQALADLAGRITRMAPRVLAFTSLNGGRKWAGPKASPGLQKEMLGSTQVWILPSPSPAARRSWSIAPWQALARAVRDD